MNEKIIYLTITIILLLVSVFAVYRAVTTDQYSEIDISNQTASQSDSSISESAKNLPVLTINETKIFVEIADDDEKRAKGFSGRQSLANNTGMLFTYDLENLPLFWMNGMQFDLDMIWINNGKVVDITENVPAPEPGTSLEDLPKYSPSQKVNAILEVNAGFVQENNIQIGDTVIFPEELGI